MARCAWALCTLSQSRMHFWGEAVRHGLVSHPARQPYPFLSRPHSAIVAVAALVPSRLAFWLVAREVLTRQELPKKSLRSDAMVSAEQSFVTPHVLVDGDHSQPPPTVCRLHHAWHVRSVEHFHGGRTHWDAHVMPARSCSHLSVPTGVGAAEGKSVGACVGPADGAPVLGSSVNLWHTAAHVLGINGCSLQCAVIVHRWLSDSN